MVLVFCVDYSICFDLIVCCLVIKLLVASVVWLVFIDCSNLVVCCCVYFAWLFCLFGCCVEFFLVAVIVGICLFVSWLICLFV